MKSVATLLIGAALFACTSSRETAASDPGQAPTAPTTQSPTLGGPDKADSLVVTLQRTPCFGRCPAYVINVYRSGYATYEGRSHVEREGMHSAWIGKDTLERIIGDAEKFGFFQFQDRYDRDVTDLPSAILRVVANGKDKRVVSRIGAPAQFKLIFDRAEGLLLPIPWRPMPTTE
ncbi:MAG: hypothetical protein IT225_05200 [Flavobacteriales bacterium]|jgi:hypothetical protein|nr:hypothetical protein [Flavobacteriales bacterium]